jgi:hypothetical protein
VGEFLTAVRGLPDEVRVLAAPLLPEAGLPESLTMAPLDDLPTRKQPNVRIPSINTHARQVTGFAVYAAKAHFLNQFRCTGICFATEELSVSHRDSGLFAPQCFRLQDQRDSSTSVIDLTGSPPKRHVTYPSGESADDDVIDLLADDSEEQAERSPAAARPLSAPSSGALPSSVTRAAPSAAPTRAPPPSTASRVRHIHTFTLLHKGHQSKFSICY